MTRILALGDSYTVGEGVGAGESFVEVMAAGRWLLVAGRWSPAAEQQSAASRRPPTASSQQPATVDCRATTGWTTGELLDAIRADPPAGPYDLVTLLIGVNNQYRGQPIGQYRSELRELLQLAIGFAGGEPDRVLLISIPDWGVTPFAEGRDRAAIAAEIDACNEVALAEARAHGTRWADVTGDSREHPGDLVADGLHPSAAAYRRWAGIVTSALHP
jgi:lysophospholipase L1-like esterase